MINISIGNKTINENSPIFIIAEVGTTCLGDLEHALKLVDVAKNAGVDAIKFQMIDSEQDSDPKASYDVVQNNKVTKMNLKEMFQKLQFSKDEWSEISDKCKECNLEFFATVDFIDGVDILEELSVNVHKIGAWDATYKQLIEKIGSTEKTMLVDLGPTTEVEIENIRRWFLDAGGKNIIFLHDYHTESESEMNMRAITHLAEKYPWPVGYSSPAHDTEVDILSIGLGARVIEKRLILDRNNVAFHAHESLEPDEFTEWASTIRRIEKTLGKKAILPSSKDLEHKKKYYRSICLKRDIQKGQEIGIDDLTAKRPGTGMPMEVVDSVVGKKALRDLAGNTIINKSDIE